MTVPRGLVPVEPLRQRCRPGGGGMDAGRCLVAAVAHPVDDDEVLGPRADRSLRKVEHRDPSPVVCEGIPERWHPNGIPPGDDVVVGTRPVVLVEPPAVLVRADAGGERRPRRVVTQSGDRLHLAPQSLRAQPREHRQLTPRVSRSTTSRSAPSRPMSTTSAPTRNLLRAEMLTVGASAGRAQVASAARAREAAISRSAASRPSYPRVALALPGSSIL